MDDKSSNGSLNDIHQKMNKNQVLSLHDHFYRKMYLDNLKFAKKNRDNRGKQSKRYRSFHGKLLDKIVDRSGLTRGKMTEFTEYNAYNSDYSDDDMESNDLPLIYQFGFASIYANSANYKDVSNIPRERKAKQEKRGRGKQTKNVGKLEEVPLPKRMPTGRLASSGDSPAGLLRSSKKSKLRSD